MYARVYVCVCLHIYIEIIREALRDTKEGIKVRGKLMKALRFPDDQAMLAGKEEDLELMMEGLK